MSNTTAGLVCGHHHLYSSLARGMPAPTRPPKTFVEILERIWWRLDRALDLELVRWSARLGALEALEAGTTAIVDHHSSPNAIEVFVQQAGLTFTDAAGARHSTHSLSGEYMGCANVDPECLD